MTKSIVGMIKISLNSNIEKHPKIREKIVKKVSSLSNKDIEDISQSYSIEKNRSELTLFVNNETETLIKEIQKVLELDSYKNVKSKISYKTVVEKKVAGKGKKNKTQEITVCDDKIIEINN